MAGLIKITNSEGKLIGKQQSRFKNTALRAAGDLSKKHPKATVEVFEGQGWDDPKLKLLHTYEPGSDAPPPQLDPNEEETPVQRPEAVRPPKADPPPRTEKPVRAKTITSITARKQYKDTFGKSAPKGMMEVGTLLAAIESGEELPEAVKPQKAPKAPRTPRVESKSTNNGAVSERHFGRREPMLGVEDDVSRMIAGLDLPEICNLAEEEYGIDCSQYNHLSNGLIRMNVANRMRGVIKRRAKEAAKAAAKAAKQQA